MYAPGPIRGMLMHYLIVMGGYLMLLAPFRAFVRLFIFEPGDGPDTEKAKEDVVELHAVGKPDDSGAEMKKRIFAKLSYNGSMYYRRCPLLPYSLDSVSHKAVSSDGCSSCRSSSYNATARQQYETNRRRIHACVPRPRLH
jgi:hypothetical protein